MFGRDGGPEASDTGAAPRTARDNTVRSRGAAIPSVGKGSAPC